MNWFKKLLGSRATSAATATPTVEPAKDPNLIRVHDAYGRELFITKQAWRDSVLLGHIEKVWLNPDALYQTIAQSLADGFTADMVNPARQLAKIDPDAERGAVTLAVVYLQLKRFTDAERVLSSHLQKHGESGIVLTNLAKVYAGRDQPDLSLRTLWHALELDPNQDNAVGWYAALFREKEGDAGELAALRRIAALPGSWRARLWIARTALTHRELDTALALYEEALSLAPRPVPRDLLQQLSGDLGNQGHLPEILRLAGPLFQIEVHGLAVGNNLIKANLDLGRLDAARFLLDQLYAQKRPDWKESLAFWDTELAKARAAISAPPPEQKLSVSMLTGNGPLWLPADSPAAELFPVAPGTPVHVAFLGSTAEFAEPGEKARHQLSDTPGRLSRAIPQFLAQEVFFHGRANVRTLVPWLDGDSPAFVFSGLPWPDPDAAGYARNGEPPTDYLVLTHLRTQSEPWTLELRLLRTIDAQCLGTASAALLATQPEAGLRQVTRDLLALLRQHTDYDSAPPPALYRTPVGTDFAHYLLRLEQLLAVRCSTMNKVPAATFLSGPREIIDGNLQFCLHQPGDVVVRLLLVQTLLRMKNALPDVVQEYREKVRLLQREKPLSGAAQAVVERLLAEVYP